MLETDEGRWWDAPPEGPNEDRTQWKVWLAGYQMGAHYHKNAADDSLPVQATQDTDIDQVTTPNGERRNSLDFFTKYGYMAAPPRTQRDRWLISRALKRHNLIQDPPTKAFDMHCALAKRFFDVAFSSISLCTDDPDVIQILSPMGAGLEDLCDISFPRSTSLCAHAMLLGEKTAVIRDRAKDWRVKNLAFAPAPNWSQQRQGGFGFYASVPIMLSAADCESDAETRVQVGRLCIVDLEPRPDFNQNDVEKLVMIGQMASADIEKVWLQKRSDLVCTSQDLLIDIRAAQTKVVQATRHASASQDEEWKSMLDLICKYSVEACCADGALVIDASTLTVHDVGQQVPSLRTRLQSSHSSERSTEESKSEKNSSSVRNEQAKPRFSSDGTSATGLSNGVKREDSSSVIDNTIKFLAHYSKGVDYDVQVSRKNLVDWLLTKPANSHLFECRSSTMQSDIEKKFGDLPESTKNPDPIAFELPNSASTYVVAAICALDGLLKFVYLQYWSGDHALERWEKHFLKHCLQAIEDTCARRRGIQAESVKLTFLQHISHELRTPLHGMAGVMSQFQGTLDSLRTVVGDNGDCNASINELAKLCTDASGLQEDLRNLVDNLIDLSAGVDKDVGEEYHMGRLTIGEEKTTFSDENVLVSIEKVCRQALQACDGSTTHDQVPWIFLSSTEAAKSMHTLAAAPKVRGILTQFLSNAIRATQGVKDNKVPLIHISVDRAGSTGEVVSIAISDNGVGMRPDILRNFKEPFVKADPHCLGMGIGATIGYAALESIGGGLKAESVIDKGTTITLTFPAQVSTKAGPSQPLPSALLRSARCTLSGSDIDQDVAKHVRSLFTDLNVELQQSPSFPLSTHEIDFVLMSDSTFLDPSQSGASPFARIKNNEVVPIVVLCRRPDSAAEIHAAYPSLPDAVHWLHCLCNPIIGPELHGLADFLQNIMTATCTSPVREQVSPMPSISLSMDSIHSKGFLTEPTSVPSRSTTPSNAFSVLVVEDNPLNLRLLAQTMRKAGCTIFSATNGREAVDEFVRKRPSVILLDISMPIMDGFKACQLIREKEVEFADEGMPPCRIIALTALSHPADKARGMEVGMDDWRTKPVNLRQIKADVERWKQAWPDEMLNVEQSVN